jgi:hypothetical protein
VEGPGSKALGRWTRFGAARRKKLTRRMSSMARCCRPEGNGSGGNIWDGGRQLAVRGGCIRRRGARGVVESVGESLEQAIHGGSSVAGMKVQWLVKGGGGRKGAPRWGWAPNIAARGGRRQWHGSGETVGGEKVVVKPWMQEGDGRYCLMAVGAVCAPSVRETDTRGARGFDFSNLSKTSSTRKSKKNALSCSKNSQIFDAARLERCEQLSKLCRYPILNRCRVKIPGTDSQFEFLMNF